MDFEKQKPVSEKYRENWERIFGAVEQVDSPKWEIVRTGFGNFVISDSIPPGVLVLADERQTLVIHGLRIPKDEEPKS